MDQSCECLNLGLCCCDNILNEHFTMFKDHSHDIEIIHTPPKNFNQKSYLHYQLENPNICQIPKTSYINLDEGILTINREYQEISLPYKRVFNPQSNHFVLMTHGLGAKNPKVKSHSNDDWLNNVLIPATNSSDTCISYIAYTARGHGNSTGWESTGEIDPNQFQWDRLSEDMLAISHNQKLESFVAAGVSQGSATSLYAAINCPEKVKAVIMIRPPKGWNRNPSKKLIAAGKCRERHPDEPNWMCLQGTAFSDYPAINSPVYRNIHCPFLILSVEGDPAHPTSTATELHRLIPNSKLHIAQSESEALVNWPEMISHFLSHL